MDTGGRQPAEPARRINTVIVTGAAGALGEAVVAEFRAAGRPVVALDRPGERLDALGEEDGVHPVPVDLADRAAVHAAFAEVDALPVTPDALVALAGGFTPGALADVDEEQLDGLFRSNFGSALWTAQAVAPRLAARGGGAIVTVGSKHGRVRRRPGGPRHEQGRGRPAHLAAGRGAAGRSHPGQRGAAVGRSTRPPTAPG